MIKIDRSFVSTPGPNTDATLEAVVALSRSLGLDVIAEGIETREELDRLRQLGQLAGQGYQFARPMPAEQAAAFEPLPSMGWTDTRTHVPAVRSRSAVG